MAAHRLQLSTEGYTVVPLILNKEISTLYGMILQDMRLMPEFTKVARDDYRFVAGAFGALGNPSSFHLTSVRNLREQAWNRWVPSLFGDDPSLQGKHIQMLFDRVSLRHRGDTIGSEAYHRDICPERKLGTVYGGWINLGDTNDSFICVPRTQKDPYASTGFVGKFTAEQTREFKLRERTIPVPPGHMIIFHQRIVHRIANQRVKGHLPRLRVYMGFAIGRPIFVDQYREAMSKYGAPPLPSGQVPPLYPRLYLVNHQTKLVDFSRGRFAHACLYETRELREGTFQVAKRYFPPLIDFLSEVDLSPYLVCESARYLGSMVLGVDELVPRYVPDE